MEQWSQGNRPQCDSGPQQHGGDMRYDEVMGEAIGLARRAMATGDVPVGALVIDDHGAVIGRGFNTREADGDPLAHAEIVAMREAAASRGDWNLADCTLAVTLEPCPMCAGACLQTRVGRIVFGAWDAKLGACGSVWDIPRDPHVGHEPEVYGGVREAECAALLAGFFATRR
ncbi:nucleoside deaminase [Bifidobacterium sp. SMA15]|uniref:tRNA-specific adenosine deaminase n=2 Tax=Bifidobacterium platyrrhinorum TaxID=2661628 RepID=A0A6L9SUZ0_9BIFI|nr:nucleoside deaminase [Bifidobacterium platyrrhinorum]